MSIKILMCDLGRNHLIFITLVYLGDEIACGRKELAAKKDGNKMF